MNTQKIKEQLELILGRYEERNNVDDFYSEVVRLVNDLENIDYSKGEK